MIVSWWELGDKRTKPVMRISNDNRKIFGPILKLSSNDTMGMLETRPFKKMKDMNKSLTMFIDIYLFLCFPH